MIICGDALTELKKLSDASVHCCVTSPPYWALRDYGVEGQLGLERTPEEYVAAMVAVFREVRRVLRDDGTLWLNLGDSYCGSWGNSGQRNELDGETDNQREKTTAYFNRGGWDKRREVPPNQKIPGLKPKDLVGIPWRVAFALQADGWYLRSDIIWAKPNPMPESVTDRPTKAHEYIFLMAKAAKYFYDTEAIREKSKWVDNDDHPLDSWGRKIQLKTNGNGETSRGGSGLPQKLGANVKDGCRNRRSVWTVTTKPFSEAHFATFPEKLIEPCILAGCPVGGVVLDPFFGAGTTGVVAKRFGRDFIGIELNPDYCRMAERRIAQVGYQQELEARP